MRPASTPNAALRNVQRARLPASCLPSIEVLLPRQSLPTPPLLLLPLVLVAATVVILPMALPNNLVPSGLFHISESLFSALPP